MHNDSGRLIYPLYVIPRRVYDIRAKNHDHRYLQSGKEKLHFLAKIVLDGYAPIAIIENAMGRHA